jgi:hypothetical protein
MTPPTEIPEAIRGIDGVDRVLKWFGYWPRFHDSEILEVRLVVNGVSTIRLHAFHVSSELDDRGYFIQDKHCQITFKVAEVTELSFTADTADIGVLFGVSIAKQGDEYILDLDPSAGLYGRLRAKTISIELEPVPLQP